MDSPRPPVFFKCPRVKITSDDVAWMVNKCERLAHWFESRDLLDNNSTLNLHLSGAGLSLRCEDLAMKPFLLSYTQGALGYRNKTASYRSEALARAMGKNPKGLRCLDVTGGYGHDSVLLATLGAQITMVERNPLITAIVSDALIRAACEAHPGLHAFTQRLNLLNMDALVHMQETPLRYDVVICDPMFPSKQKNARSKLDMQILQSIQEPPTLLEEQSLLEACLKAAPRVVVKRPLHAPFLAELKPHHSLTHKTVRFDVYLQS